MNGRPAQMHLGVSVIGVGSHAAAWRVRDPSAPRWFDVEHYLEMARLAERGTFDVVMLADVPEDVRPDARPPLSGLEPTLLVASMAGVTDRVGFIATVSTTFNEPYNLARRFASLDHMTKGRVSINAVTTYNPRFAALFGVSDVPSHEMRYARAAEFLDVLVELWDSWEDGAVVADRESGVFTDPSKIHPVDHDGPWFSVHGQLPLPRSPQGRPVLTQAGASEQGRDLAARYAEVVYATSVSLADAQEYYRDLKARAAALGRPPGLPKILLGVHSVVGVTTDAAHTRRREMDRLLDRSGDLAELAHRIGARVADLDLDAPLPEHVVRGARQVETGSRGFAEAMVNLAVRDGLTVRRLLERKDKFLPLVGDAGDIADGLEEWFRSGAADGFILNVDVLPTGLGGFVDLVVPELRRRGVFRSAYAGSTLRDHLGLHHPSRRPAEPAGAIGRAGPA